MWIMQAVDVRWSGSPRTIGRDRGSGRGQRRRQGQRQQSATAAASGDSVSVVAIGLGEGVAHPLGCSRRQVMARTWSKRSRADRARPGPASCFALRRDRPRSKLRVTHVACPGVVRNVVSNEAWWSRSRPDRPCPSERLAATEVADLTTWSARLVSGAGTLLARARARPAASRAVVRAMSWLGGGSSMVTSGSFMTPTPMLPGRSGSRVAQRLAVGRLALDPGRPAATREAAWTTRR